ncbi:unnamed protein product, partial [Polarella glacialis]
AASCSGPPPQGEFVPRLARMRRCLRAVGLEHVLTREQDGWLARRSWEEVLGLEEQQKLCLARVLYHEPAFCLLDEATSAVPISTEGALHRKLQEWGVTPVALSRRPFLLDFYQRELRLGLSTEESSNSWQLLEAN